MRTLRAKLAALVALGAISVGAAGHAAALTGRSPCVGDCDGSGVVTVSEILTGVEITLGSVPVSACPAFQCRPNSSGVFIQCVIVAVNNVLSGCPATPTSTPMSAATPTEVMVPSRSPAPEPSPSVTSTPTITNSPTPVNTPSRTPALTMTPSPARIVGAHYIDCVTGSDAKDGATRATAWRTLARALARINDAAIPAGDTVLMRPCRYYVLDGQADSSLGATTWQLPGVSNQVRGGLPGRPITFSVDTTYPGDVEITASLTANWNTRAGKSFDRTIAWTPAAYDCTGNGSPWGCCAGDRRGCAGISYTTGASPNASAGVGAGVCFQPGLRPGEPPALWETLYAPETAPVTMPSFTAGRRQCWFRPEYASMCTGPDEPYACCSAAGVGVSCLNTTRVYAQAGDGSSPAATAPPVEFTLSPNALAIGRTGEVQYISFTNHNNGRIFHWRWATRSVLSLHNAHHLVFEDFTVGYNSATRAFCDKGSGPTCVPGKVSAGSRSGAGFPRDTGGAAYLILETEQRSDHHHHNTFRRGIVQRAQGDEAIHLGVGELAEGTNAANCVTVADCTQTTLGTAVLCFAGSCYYQDLTSSGDDLFEDVQILDQPWEVANGDTSVYGYAYGWPPAGYARWMGVYGTHFSPLGGGGQSPGAWTIQSQRALLRRITIRNVDGMAAFETVADGRGRVRSWPAGALVDQATVDALQRQYGGGTLTPYCATCKCRLPGRCGGFNNVTMLKDGIGGWDIDQPGSIWRNIIITNCRGGCYAAIRASSGRGRALGPRFEASTIYALGDHSRTASNRDRIRVDNKWGTAVHKGSIRNVILVQRDAGNRNTLTIDAGNVATVEIDHNLYGPGTSRWKWGARAPTTSFGQWRADSEQDANSPLPSDPLFAGPPDDLRISPASPAVDAGATLAEASFDHDGNARPQGPGWDIGACEVPFNAAQSTPASE